MTEVGAIPPVQSIHLDTRVGLVTFSDGSKACYPLGSLGRGFLCTPKTESFLWALQTVWTLVGLAALAIPDQETARYTLVLILIAAYVKVSYWIGRQAPEAPRLAYRDFCQLNAQQMSGWVIGSMFLAGNALVVLTYFVAAKPDWLGACLCFSLGVFLVYRSVLVARIKWSLQHQ